MQKNTVEYLQCILDNLTSGLISVNVSGTVDYINPMAGKILHWNAASESLEEDYNETFRNFPALCQVIREALETRKTTRRAELSIMHADVPLTIGYSTMRFKDHEGRNAGVIVIFQNISFVGGEKKQYEQKK